MEYLLACLPQLCPIVGSIPHCFWTSCHLRFCALALVYPVVLYIYIFFILIVHLSKYPIDFGIVTSFGEVCVAFSNCFFTFVNIGVFVL